MSLLCRIGLHRPSQYPWVFIFKKGRHKWQRTYIICERCGKKLRKVKWKSPVDKIPQF